MSKEFSANIHDPNHTVNDYDLYFNGDPIESSGGEWTTEGLADGSEPNGKIDLNDCTNVAEYAFARRRAITRVIGNSVTSIGECAFARCIGLLEISFPNVVSIGLSTFDKCYALRSVNFPNLKTGGDLAFANCSSLEMLDLPKMESLNYNGVFQACKELKRLILRNPAVVPINSNCFAQTPFTGYLGKTADLYVPSDLISAYQADSNWSTILSNGFTTIHAIEGSEYE